MEEVEATLDSLISREPDALVMRLPRQPGQKEARFAHLLSGEVSVEVERAEAAPARGRSRDGDRVTSLEAEVETLKAEVGMLKTQFEVSRNIWNYRNTQITQNEMLDSLLESGFELCTWNFVLGTSNFVFST